MNPFRIYLATRSVFWHWWKNARFVDSLIASLINMGTFYSKASKYKALPAYFRALFDAFLGLPYCIRNRDVCRELSYKDLDDLRRIVQILDVIHIKPLFRIIDRVYEKAKFYSDMRNRAVMRTV